MGGGWGMRRLGILVSGSGTNMASIAEACAAGPLTGLAVPALVLSNKPGVGALEKAARFGIPAEVVPHAGHPTRESHEQAVLDRLREHRVDLVVLAGYMRILTPAFLSGAPGPVLNIHPVPTHLYQGAAGYEDLWARRDRIAANYPTVHLVDAGVDTGDVVLYGLPYPTAEAASLEALRERGLAEEHQLYPEAIRYLVSSPHLVQAEPESSTSELTGISALSIDLMDAGVQARKRDGGKLLCMAQRDWQGTGYRIHVQRDDGETEGDVKVGWLAGSERAAFTKLVLDMVMLGREIPVEFLYEGMRIDLTDSRSP